MKCPVCNAQLLPVDGEFFCLQCGESVHQSSAGEKSPDVHETVDPLLQRAITDATDGDIMFSEVPQQPAPAKVDAPVSVVPTAKQVVPEAEARSPKQPAQEHEDEEVTPAQRLPGRFASLRTLVAPPRPMTSGVLVSAQGVGAVTRPHGVDASEVMGPQLSPVHPQVTGLGAEAPLAPAAPVVSTSKPSLWWMGVVTATVAALVGVNLWIGASFAHRAYPGTKVAGVAVGGKTFDEIVDWARSQPAPGMQVRLAGETHQLGGGGRIAQVDADQLRLQLEEDGHTTPLALAGAVRAYFHGDMSIPYRVDETAASKAVANLATGFDEVPTNARALVTDRGVLLLSDKPGRAINQPKAVAAISSAYGKVSIAELPVERLEAKVVATDLNDEVAAASSILGATLDVVIRGTHRTINGSQTAGWLYFGSSGEGARIDRAGVESFIASVPGKFDRQGAVASITAALNAGKSTTINVGNKSTSFSKSPTAIPALPLVTYTYCSSSNDKNTTKLADSLTSTLKSGWDLGGRIAFVQAESGCMFRLSVVDATSMAKLDSACAKQTTCRLHNTLYIAASSWTQPPATWTQGLASYQRELINHVVGQWLGFEHARCIGTPEARPLSQAAVVVPGCSPQWYPIPAESQDTKILPGF